jgi:tripartite-type tricarboxylate transporter receptor subunit TctC
MLSRIARLAAVVLLACTGAAHAFDAKQVTLKVGYGPGGTYDLSSRLVARFLGQHLPGTPEIIVQNVAGGGSLKLTKLMLGSEPADGSVIASISPSMPFAPILDPANVDFDTSKIVWLGSLSSEPSFCIASKASGIDTMEKFLTGDFKMGASAKNSSTYQLAALVRNGLGAKFDIVTGFAGVPEIELAIERGELAGHCVSTEADLDKPGFIDKFNIIGRLGSGMPQKLGDVPRFSTLIKDPTVRAAAEFIEASRDINYPLMIPPGTPPETVKLFRDAYAAVLSDPDFAKAVDELGEFSLSPKTGEEMQAIVEHQLGVDKTVTDAARKLLQ